MELEKVILERRSVRKYQDKPVEREKINACLRHWQHRLPAIPNRGTIL